MILKLHLPIVLFFLVSTALKAQENEQCKSNLSYFSEYVKSGNLDAAYEPWTFVRANCPEMHVATYIYGEKILDHKIDKANAEEKLKFIEDLKQLWLDRAKYFEDIEVAQLNSIKKCQLDYDFKKMNGLSDSELYSCFDDAFKKDRESFVHPKSLYAYFSLMVNLYDGKKKTDSELFTKYDEITEKVEEEIKKYSIKLNTLLENQDENQVLSNKEEKNKNIYESYLENYDLISKNIDNLLGQRANCENLIPLYTKEFSSRQNDSVWLKRSVSRMFHKECTEEQLYEKLVMQYDKVAPSADTKIFVATVLFKNGKPDLAGKYLEEAFDLEKDTFKKANLAIRIGIIFKQKNQFSKARNYFRNALRLNPANGKPHLSIASMYNESANNCGDSNFSKRAVFWLAAEEARKASKTDPTLKQSAQQTATSYEAKAPTKEEIFIAEMSGKKLNIGCWINETITVPEIK